jgi:cytochrome c oxidase subunit 3
MADTHAKHHDYHLVNPSPWPAVGATAAFITAVGLIIWMRSMGRAPASSASGARACSSSVLGLLFTVFMWWRDVIKEAHGGDHTPVVQLHLRYGMILFHRLGGHVLRRLVLGYFDAALCLPPSNPSTSSPDGAVEATKEVLGMVKRDEIFGGHWPPKPAEIAETNGYFHGTFDPWGLPLVNTLILLTSGTTVTWAHHALLENNRKGLVWGLVLTVILGILFTTCQAYEYIHAGFSYAGHTYGSTFFMATGFHGAHVIIGTLFPPCASSARSPRSRPGSTSGSRRPPGTGTSSTSSGCSSSCASTCGERERPHRIDNHPSSRKPMPWRRLSGIWRRALRFLARSRIALCASGMTGRDRRRSLDMTQDVPQTSWVAAGLKARCPRCGEGALFRSGLTLRDKCERCGLSYAFADSGDGPAVFGILILGFLVLGGALMVEFKIGPPAWVHVVLWGLLTPLLAFFLLRVLKATLIALQTARRVEVVAGPDHAHCGCGGLAVVAAQVIADGVDEALVGTWQLQRKAWKDQLIAKIAERVTAPPIRLAGDGQSGPWRIRRSRVPACRLQGPLPSRQGALSLCAGQRRARLARLHPAGRRPRTSCGSIAVSCPMRARIPRRGGRGN